MRGAAAGRRVGLLTVLVGLLAAVAVASRLPLSSHGGAGASSALRGTASALVLVAPAGGVVLLLLIASALRGALRRGSPEDEFVAQQPAVAAWKALPMLALLVTFALAAVVVIEALAGAQIHSRSKLTPATATRPAAPGGAAGGPAPKPAGGADVELPIGALVAGAGLIVLVLASAAGLGLRARWPRADAGAARERILEAEIDAAIADLVSGSSARRAVIGAYVRMERALAGRALAHRASEAPREYLARARAALGTAGESAGRLTELFEEAKFSPHEIGEPMRREAIAALTALRAELDANLDGER